jgi:lipid II:glycine glycyltransferase (peptidoglycan interpeptide bridge formation enzyme)
LDLIDRRLLYYKEFLRITKVIYFERILVMHAYLCDKDSKTVRLLHSSRNLSFEDNKLIGYANKFLHFQDMLFFKKEGYAFYDFGGIDRDSTNPVILGINRFKEGFGGMLKREYNLVSYPLSVLKKLR